MKVVQLYFMGKKAYGVNLAGFENVLRITSLSNFMKKEKSNRNFNFCLLVRTHFQKLRHFFITWYVASSVWKVFHLCKLVKLTLSRSQLLTLAPS